MERAGYPMTCILEWNEVLFSSFHMALVITHFLAVLLEILWHSLVFLSTNCLLCHALHDPWRCCVRCGRSSDRRGQPFPQVQSEEHWGLCWSTWDPQWLSLWALLAMCMLPSPAEEQLLFLSSWGEWSTRKHRRLPKTGQYTADLNQYVDFLTFGQI